MSVAAMKVQPRPPELRAALRDATWYRCPSTNGSKYHVVVSPHAFNGISACNLFTIPVHRRSGVDESLALEDVRPGMRCMRPGCRARWPA